MLARVHLQNFRSFGAPQTAPLEAITVLVGANNSGKSSFLGFTAPLRQGLQMAQLLPLRHRPPFGDGSIHLGLELDAPYDPAALSPSLGIWDLRLSYPTNAHAKWDERITIAGNETLTNRAGENIRYGAMRLHNQWAMPILAKALTDGIVPDDGDQRLHITTLLHPVLSAKEVHLKVDAMRAPNQLHPSPSIAPDGSNLAALIAYWELEEPEQLVRFNQIMRDCVPELSRVSVTCTNHGQVSLQFKQRDSQLFGVTEVSDGVLVFAGLIAHALRAPSGALMLMEEPERGIHPRRLGELVDLLRTLVKERGTQFIMATHSPALLNVFNDEPEAILLFSRTPEGTSIRRLSDSPALIETLGRADPGEMLANGVFNEDIGDAADSRDSK